MNPHLLPSLLVIGWLLIPGGLRGAETPAARARAAGETTVRPTTVTPGSRPLLWRVEGLKASYVFGTIHLGDPRVTAISPVVSNAMAGCDGLFTEIPMGSRDQLQVSRLLITTNQTLSRALPRDLYDRAQAEVRRIDPDLTLEPFEKLEIWALATTLPLLAEQMEHPGRQPLDAILYNRARKARKQVGGIETAAEQLGVFRRFTTAEQLDFLRATLDQMATDRQRGTNSLEELTLAYLGGDLVAIDRLLNNPGDTASPELNAKFVRLVITERNRVMAERIEARLKRSPEKGFFFAVGAGHLGGDTGILRLLEKAGYKLVRVTQ